MNFLRTHALMMKAKTELQSCQCSREGQFSRFYPCLSSRHSEQYSRRAKASEGGQYYEFSLYASSDGES